MIISHKNRYLFIEIPHTGSTAISHELRTHYGGEKILRKHSFYSDFLRIATSVEKNYFVFAGVRNPLDETVTRCYKNYRPNSVDGKGRQDFQAFFLKHYNKPYNNFACMIPDRCQFLIRFENLQEDFARLLQLLELEQVRPLPVRNPTRGRNKDFRLYYTPEIIPRAKRVFGPFMKQWGYSFPREWGDYSPTPWHQLGYEWFSFMRRVKWKYLRSTP